ncbi:hypothetical protein ES703_116932 [subsurface metagenome]
MRGMSVSKREGGEGRVMSVKTDIIVKILCRCPQCRGVNRFVVDWDRPRKTSKCQVCGEIIPTGAYRTIATSNDPNHPIF